MSQQSYSRILIPFFILSLFLFLVDGKMNFERNIWVYWETDFEKAPLITKISFEKLQKAAHEANWKLILVNGTNVRNYLKDYNRFEQVVKKGYRNTVQQKSDILRISLVEQNGGVWIDFACILLDDLQWLSNQKLFEHMIINRIGTNLDDPDMLMLGQGWHQSPLSYYNQNGSLVTDEYFGMGIHFVAAKKKSRIMTEWKQKMYKVCIIPYTEFIKQLYEKRFYFHNIDRTDMYYSGNIALQQTIQQKQFQIDNNLTLFSQRKNAYQHYKIWSFHGEVGPIAMTRKHALEIRDLFMETKQQVEARMGKLWFYLKLAKFLRQGVEEYKEESQKYFRQNKGLTVQSILKRGPTNKECSLPYIVQGSILYNFYNGSRYESEIHTPFITVEQRQELKQHCQFIAHSIYYSWYGSRSEGQGTQPQRQLFHNEYNSLIGRIKMFWMTNSLVIKAGLEQWRAIMFTLILYIIFRNSSMKDLLKAFLDRYRNEFNEKIPFYQMLSNRLNTLQKTFQNVGKPVEYKQAKWSREKSIAVFIVLVKTILGSVSLQFYENIQDLGKYPQYEFSLLIMITIILVDKWLQNLSARTNYPSNMFVEMSTVSKAMRFVIYLPLGFVAFIHFDIVYGLAYYHTMVIVGGGLLMYTLMEQLRRRGISNNLTNITMSLLEMSKYLCLAIFTTFYFIKNLRYIRHNNHYVKQSLSDIAMYVFVLISTLTMTLLGLMLMKRLSSRQQQASSHSSQQKQRQSQSIQQQQQFSSTNSLLTNWQVKQLLASFIVIVLVMLKTYSIFSDVKQSPSSYNIFNLFKFHIFVFIACGLSTQLNIPEELDFRRKAALACFTYALSLIYLIFGLTMLQFIFFVWVVDLIIFTAICAYVVGVACIVEQLNTQDTDNINRQQVEDIEYEVVRTHQELKYDQRPSISRY